MRLGIISFIAVIFTLLFVSQVTACFVVYPAYYHLGELKLSNDPDIILVKVLNPSRTEITTLAFSISQLTLSKNFDATELTSDLESNLSKSFRITMVENTTGQYLVYPDPINKSTAIFLDVSDFGISNKSYPITGLIYPKLDRIYIQTEYTYMHNNGTWLDENFKLVVSLSTNQIIQNGSNVFPDRLDTIDLDLDIGIAPQNRSLCEGLGYYRISESGFDFIVETSLLEDKLFNVIADKIHIVSYDKVAQTSTIESFSAHSQSSSTFTISDSELRSIMDAVDSTTDSPIDSTTDSPIDSTPESTVDNTIDFVEDSQIQSDTTELLNILTSLSLITAIGILLLGRRLKKTKNSS